MEIERKMPAKRRKLTASDGVVLHADALRVVMDYLAPREMFRLAFCSKELMNSITTKMVVRSALLHGGHAKTTIDLLAPLMKSHSIFVPTPLRLLRLVNGKRCERGRCSAKVNHIREGYANFYCWECHTEFFTTSWKTSWVRYQRNPKISTILSHPRMAARLFGKDYYLAQNLFTTHGGEKYGPLLCYNHVDSIALSKETVEDVLTQMGAPTPDQYEEFIQTFDEFVQRSEEAAQERSQKQRQKRLNTAANRKAKVIVWMEKLKPLLSVEWQELALQYVDLRVPSAGKMPILQFRIAFVEKLLHDYVLSPSRMNKASLEQTSQEINETFIRMQDFLKFDFLCEKEPFDSKLKPFCVQEYPDLKSLVKKSEISIEFCNALRDQRNFYALKCLYRNFGFILSPDRNTTFAIGVWAHEYYKIHSAPELPTHLSDSVNSIQRQEAILAQKFRQTFSISLESLPKMSEVAKEYLSWLEQNPKHEELHAYGWMQRAVYEGSYLSYLESHDFEGLTSAYYESRWREDFR